MNKDSLRYGLTLVALVVVLGRSAESEAGQPAKQRFPLKIEIWDDTDALKVTAVSVAGGSDVFPAQAVSVGPDPLQGVWSLLPDPVSGDVSPVTKTPAPTPFRFEESDKRLMLRENDRPVFAFAHAMQLPDGIPADRRRSCYVHPVYGIRGEILSDDFPADHYHHRGIFWTWPQVIIDGKSYDQWTIKGANRRFHRWLDRVTGPVCAIVGLEDLWVVDGKPVLRETVWIQAFRTRETYRFIDFAITLRPLTGPITLGGRKGTGYGGFCFRAGGRENTVLTVPTGVLPKDNNLTPFAWADLSARFAGRDHVSGVAILPHAANPGVPNGWTLRHYGFLGTAWPGGGWHTVSPDKPLTLRYRVVIHDGPASVEFLARANRLYAR